MTACFSPVVATTGPYADVAPLRSSDSSPQMIPTLAKLLRVRPLGRSVAPLLLTLRRPHFAAWHARGGMPNNACAHCARPPSSANVSKVQATTARVAGRYDPWYIIESELPHLRFNGS
jgi:hypothetical protein